MPVSGLISKIFSGETSANAEAVIQAAFLRSLADKERTARQDAQRLIDWYNRDRVEILLHLKDAARKTFDSTSDWQFPIINGVPRTIQRRSTSYKTPPERKYWLAGKELEPDSPPVMAIAAMLGSINVDRKMRTMDRFATLLNTIHTEIVVRKKKLDWDLRLRPSVTVIPDPEDYLEFTKFAYKWNPTDPDTLRPLEGWVYWTQENHVFVGEGGVWVGMTNDAGTNPYTPEVPIVTVRKIEDIDDYWGAFGADLVDATQAMNLQLGNLWETMFLQTHGWPLLINVELSSGAKVLVGPKHPLVAKKVTKDDVPPDVKFPKPDPDLEEVQGVLDWFQKMNAGAYGLPPSTWSMDEQRQSGFAKFMDNIELMESREEEMSVWESVENDLLHKSIMVWNYWKLGPEVNPEIDIKLKFPAIKVPETPTEKISRWGAAIRTNLSTAADYFVEEEGLERDAAEDRALEVADANRQITEAAQPAIPGLPPPISPKTKAK